MIFTAFCSEFFVKYFARALQFQVAFGSLQEWKIASMITQFVIRQFFEDFRTAEKLSPRASERENEQKKLSVAIPVNEI